MSREIKFKFWCNDHGHIESGFDEPIESVNFNQRNELGLLCPICYKARPMKLRQYTGLKDKNGREIFEGDILEYVSPEPQEDDRPDFYKVEWKGFGFEARWLNPYSATASSDGRLALSGADEDMKVIGNIYENPELLNTN